MILSIDDWQFDVDTEATLTYTVANAADHCNCGYCKNYYDTVEQTYPELKQFLDQFGVCLYGPSELMPFEPTLYLSCYRVQGKILRWGYSPLQAGQIPVAVEASDTRSFLLWAGEMVLPWVQEEDPFEVISPANYPEFIERMNQVLLQRYGEETLFS